MASETLPNGRRPPRPRLTVAGLLLSVAMIAVILLGPRVWERRERADRHHSDAIHWHQAAAWCLDGRALVSKDRITPERRDSLREMGYRVEHRHVYHWEVNNYSGPVRPVPPEERPLRDEVKAACRERAEYHEQMRRKWAWAAWMPWSRVDPDGPMPPVEGSVTDQSY